MKFERQLRPATETSWVVWSCMVVKQFQDGRRPPFWKSIYLHISVKNHLIFMKFCTQQQILNWMNVAWSKMNKLHWTDSEFDRTYFLFHLSVKVCINYRRAKWRATPLRKFGRSRRSGDKMGVATSPAKPVFFVRYTHSTRTACWLCHHRKRAKIGVHCGL